MHTNSRIQLSFWHKKMTAEASIASCSSLISYFEMCHLYTHLYEYISQARIRIVHDWTCQFRKA